MKVRRVVTGHDQHGKAVIASDEAVEPITPALLPGSELHWLWGADASPGFPDDGSMPPHRSFFPGLGGFRFGFFTLPPAGTAPSSDVDPAAGFAELEALLPGWASFMEPDDPGMHTTDTIDFEVVLKGQAILELDDGAETVLNVGDTVVQNGTRHRWHNRLDVPAVLAVVLIGARRP